MIKTCISVAAIGKAPEIVKHMIDKIGFPISTIVIEPKRVSFYFCYKWYDYYHVYKIKREVKILSQTLYLREVILPRNKVFFRTMLKNQSQGSPTPAFKDILKAEMEKLQ